MFSFLWCAGFCSVLTLFFSCFQQLPGGNKVNDTSPQSLALKGRGWLGCSSVLAKAPKSEVWLPKMEEKEVEDPRSSGNHEKVMIFKDFIFDFGVCWKEMNDVQFLGWAEVIFFSQIRARIRIYGSQISETNVDRTSEVWEGAGSICFVGISCVPIPGVVLHGFAFCTVSTVKTKPWRKCNDLDLQEASSPKADEVTAEVPSELQEGLWRAHRTSESQVKSPQRSMDLDVWQINGQRLISQ